MSKLHLVSLLQMCSQARKRSDLWLHSFPTPNLATDLDSSVMSKPSPTIFFTTIWPSSRQPSFRGSLQSRAFTGTPAFLFHGFLSTEPSGWCFQDLSHSTPLFGCKFPVASHLVWNKSQRWQAGCLIWLLWPLTAASPLSRFAPPGGTDLRPPRQVPFHIEAFALADWCLWNSPSFLRCCHLTAFMFLFSVQLPKKPFPGHPTEGAPLPIPASPPTATHCPYSALTLFLRT